MRSSLRRNRRRELASIAALALLIGVPTGIAVLHHGFPVTDVDLDARNVWVTNGEELLAGRLSKPIAELDGAVSTASRHVDVLQHGDDVFLHDGDAGAIERIDPSYTTLVERTEVPPGSTVAYGGDVLAVMSPAGDVWAIDAAAPLALDATDATALVEAGSGAMLAVTPAGTVFVSSPRERTLLRFDRSGGEPDRTGLPELGAHQLAAVGEHPVILDLEGDRVITDQATIDLPAGAVALQQTGPDDDSVLVATGTELLDAPLDGGDVRRIDVGITADLTDSADVSAPVRLDGCAHGAWAGAGRYAVACGEGGTARSIELDRPTHDTELVFRVNRSVIALNDVLGGNAWLVDSDLRLIEDWAEVTPPDEEQAEDGDEVSSTQSFEDTIAQRTDRNRPPTARDDVFGIRPGTTTIIPVLDNDTDPDGDVLTIATIGEVAESQGVVDVIDGGRALQFTPSASMSGSLSFRYAATDGHPGGISEAQVDLAIAPFEENAAPEARSAVATSVEQGQRVSINVLRDWRDPDGDAIFLVSATPRSGDAVSFAPDGEVSFEHRSSELGTKEVAFVVSDGTDQATGTLIVEVEPAGSLHPVGTPDFAETTVGTAVAVEPLANDTSPSGAPLALLGLQEFPDGVEVKPNLERGTISVTAAEPGSYTVLYQLGAGASSSVGLLRVDVHERSEEPRSPIAVADIAYLRAGVPISVPVLANDVSPNGDVLGVQAVDANGADASLAIEVLTNAVVRITPSSALTEQVQLRVTIGDGRSTATSGLTVVPIPPLVKHQPPVAVDDDVRVRAGDIVSVPVLDNDHHPDQAPLDVAPELVDDDAAAGGLAFVSGDRVRFQAPDEPGVFSVDYRVVDAHGETAVASVRFTVVGRGGENSAPSAAPLTTRTFAGSTVKVEVPTHGLDPDGDSVAVRGVTSTPRLGRITATDTGSIEYQAYPGMSGTDAFEYEVEDTGGERATGTIRVGVIPRPATDAPPNAVDDLIEIRPGSVASVPVWRNDSDPNGYRLAVDEELVEVDEGIEASVEQNRVIVEAPRTEGTFTIRYRIGNGHGGVDTAFVQVLVSEDARPVHPSSVDQFVANEDLEDDTAVVDVLEGAENPGGRISDLVVSLEGPGSAHGEILPDGEVRVRAGDERRTLAYRLTNSVDGLATTSFIIVPPRPDGGEASEATAAPPYLVDLPPQRTPVDTPIEWSVADLVVVPSGRPPLVLSASATNGDGSDVELDGATLRFAPAKGYRGPASVSFAVTDGTSESDPDGALALLTIPVTVADADLADVAPTFTAQSVTVEAGEDPLVIDLRDSAAHPNPTLVEEISFGGLTGATTDVNAVLTGSQLMLTVPRGVQPGATATIGFEVRLRDFVVPGGIEVVVVSSTRPLARAVADPDETAGAVHRPAQTIVLDVLANDFDPFAAQGERLRVVGAVLDQSEVAAVAAISFTDDTVTIRTGPAATGTLSAVYTVQDATGDRTRRVQGRIALSIVDVPDAPRAPTVVEGDAQASVTISSTASNNAPIIDYSVTWSGGQLTVPREGTYTVSGLRNGTDYAFRVTARNAVGSSAASPESVSVRPFGVPGAPASARLSATMNGTGDMTLSWSPPASDGGRGVGEYRWRQVGTAGSQATNATAVNIRGTVGAPVAFEVQACNARGCGEWATSNSATPTAPPPWTPTHHSTTITQSTCPEPASAYPSGPWNADSGCAFQPQGALPAGTVIDAHCYSQRNGEHWLYFTSEVGVYDGWFVFADHTSRPGRSLPDC
ncbi:Ig-like domain-containing protein [Agromyces sp. Marseille-Q5079]|uniref:Ig-like domain-containing protein n=1 Tax=Agromyces sp. Marseille-Q5079 TaxID=3439059 RepID=UPI003D9C9826